MSPMPPRAPEPAPSRRTHAPTSFLPGFMPYQALQLGAMATGPKQLKKSLRESHRGVTAATNQSQEPGGVRHAKRRKPWFQPEENA